MTIVEAVEIYYSYILASRKEDILEIYKMLVFL